MSNETKPTVVVSLKDLKELEKNEANELVDGIEFFIDTLPSNKIKIIAFDLKNEITLNSVEKITDIDELKVSLLDKEKKILLLAFHQNPALVNKICTQVKEKCPHVKTIILAKNLSQEKMKIHQASKAGANAYANLPCSDEQISEIINQI